MRGQPLGKELTFMRESIKEPARELPVTDTCDVLVAGGGIAGVSAALAAARNGADVLLLEREFGLGGLATLGLIAIFLPLCDGRGNQVCGGICEELFRLSIVHGAEEGYPVPRAWLENSPLEERVKQRFLAQFNPVYFALEMEGLLRREGVRILYGTQAAAVQVEGNRITHVFVENKSGRSAIRARMYVDCTGDADLAARAGVETALFGDKNGLASWYYYISGKKKVRLSMFGLADVRPREADSGQKGTNESADIVSGFRFSGVDGPELSEAVQQAHELMLLDMGKHVREDKEFAPVAMSSIPLVRMSRRICGASTLTVRDDHREMPDSIGMTGDWCKRGPVYEIPFGCLYNPGIVNLLAAGRIISTDDTVWNVTRVIPPCAVTGEAAGTAAAIASDVTKVDIDGLQAQLARHKVLIHIQG